MKKLRFGLFENPQANDSGTSTWRHPDNKRDMFDRLDYWREITTICEEAGFDFMFLADAWGWADVNGERPDICSVEGLDLPRLDPAILAAALISTTTNLGLVLTGSTLLEQPYAFARRIASLDHLSGGRIGWNVVTTGTAETASQAFGVPMVAHDERYDMADDFMEVVYKLRSSATRMVASLILPRCTASNTTARTLSLTVMETPHTRRRAPRCSSKRERPRGVESSAASMAKQSSSAVVRWRRLPSRLRRSARRP